MTKKPTSASRAGILFSGLLAGVAGLFSIRSQDAGFSRPQRLLLLAVVLAGALVRFSSLGAYGLHAPDEGTTALPVLHILEDGWPRFPSGMLYTRAVFQSYVMAGSVALFGNTEWALRLPSVLCGTLLIWLATLVGRRFLSPAWNLGFAAVVAFLPGLVTDSQVARMYIFLLATLAVYTHWVWRWEATDRRRYLIAAVLTMMVGIHFHQLAIFGSLVLFMPPLLQADARRLRAACYAFVPIMAYFVYIRWTPSEYPLPITDFDVPESSVGRAPGSLGLRFLPVATAGFVIAALVAGWWYVRSASAKRGAVVVPGLLLVAAIAAAGLHYHLAILVLLAAGVVAGRQGRPHWPVALGLLLLFAAAALYQLHMVRSASGETLRRSLGVMIGQPSVWQYVAAASYSLVATVIVAGGLLAALAALASRRRLPDVWLYFVLSVALPLFVMGFTDWYFPPRYTEYALLPLLLTALAIAQAVARRWSPVAAPARMPAAILVVVVAVASPWVTARELHAPDRFADHRGAALYIREQRPTAGDIIVAEDVLYPYYYLGRVDYWLMGRLAAKGMATRVDGQVVYQYTHTPLIGTAAELEALIARPDRGTLYIIGSGEDMADGRRYLRGDGIDDLLDSGRLATVFVGRDGRTRVWRVPPPAAGAP